MNRFIRAGFEKAGLVTDHGPIVAVNANMSDPHYEPAPEGSREIRKGDAVLIDMWAKLDRPSAVYYDITWTGYCGAGPPARSQNIFEVVRDARDRAIQRVQAAIPRARSIHGFEVDDAARAYIKRQGIRRIFRPPHRPLDRRRGAWHRRQHGQPGDARRAQNHRRHLFLRSSRASICPNSAFAPKSTCMSATTERRVTGEVQRALVTIQ